MNEQEIIELVHKSLFDIAPELEGEAIDACVPLRDQFDIDSMDFLNLMIALHEATGVEIPESAYPLVATVQGIADFIRKKQTD